MMAKNVKRHRSPAYPSIGLEVAIDRARAVWEYERRTPTSADVIVTHWGYAPNSANGMRCLAALKQYGLLDETGERGERVLKLSDRALAILLDETEDSPERDEAISEAALAPKLYRDLWNERPDASGSNLRTYLIRDREFNPTAVDSLIGQYRKTVAFAKLGKSGILSVDLEDKNAGDGPDPKLPDGLRGGPKTLPSGSNQAVLLPVLETDGTIRTVSIPHLSEQAFTFLKNLLDQYKTAIVKNPEGRPQHPSDNDANEAAKPAPLS